MIEKINENMIFFMIVIRSQYENIVQQELKYSDALFKKCITIYLISFETFLHWFFSRGLRGYERDLMKLYLFFLRDPTPW